MAHHPEGGGGCELCVRDPLQIPLGAQPDLGTQPRYEAPGDLRVKIVEKQELISG